MTHVPKNVEDSRDRRCISVYTSREVHAALREEAIRRNEGMGPMLVRLFLATLSERKRESLNLTLPRPIAISEGRMKPRKRPASPELAMCTECLKRHVNLPGAGPWHAKECRLWRLRAAII